MKEIFEWKELEQDLLTYISKIPTGCIEVSRNLREKNFLEASKDINDLVEGIDWIIKVNNYTRVKNIAFPINIKRVLEIWKDFNEYLNDEEYENAADLLEYEFIEEFNLSND